jgi:hypothetical protein
MARLFDDGGDLVLPDKKPHLFRPSGDSPFGEVYLELAAVDLTDDDDLLHFYERYGGLGMCHRPDADPNMAFTAFLGPSGMSGYDDAIAPTLLDHRRDLGLGFEDESLQEFLFGAACIKDLVTAWRVLSGQAQLEDADWAIVGWADDLLTEEDRSYFVDPAWFFRYALPPGLAAFGPAAHVLHSSNDPTELPPGFLGAHSFRREALESELSLFSVLCLELFNHIAEQSSYRICANERCGKLFVRQSGRALHGQHRTKGVKYCSAECARCQAQRQYRRRQAKKKKQRKS